jgi:hypothetical protein
MHRSRQIHQVDPETGAILRTIESNRFVTGVTWVDGELWHGTWQGDESHVRRVDLRRRARVRSERRRHGPFECDACSIRFACAPAQPRPSAQAMPVFRSTVFRKADITFKLRDATRAEDQRVYLL